MVTHDDLSLCALILSGIAGALLADPFGNAMRAAVRRVRTQDPR